MNDSVMNWFDTIAVEKGYDLEQVDYSSVTLHQIAELGSTSAKIMAEFSYGENKEKAFFISHHAPTMLFPSPLTLDESLELFV